MSLRIPVFAAGFLCALGLLASAAAAGPPTDRLRRFFAETNAVITDEATATRPQEKLEAIRRLVRDLFAFREAAEHVLGAEWQARTPAERDEFVALFTDVAESSFVSALAARARLDGGAQVSVLEESAQGETAIVKTVVAARSGSDVQVDYHMRRLAGRWAVSDVTLDGVSLADNYRAQARRMIERVSFAGMLAEMRARAHGGSGTAGSEVAALPESATRPSPTAAATPTTAVDAAAGPTPPAATVSRTSPEPARLEPARAIAEPSHATAAPARTAASSPETPGSRAAAEPSAPARVAAEVASAIPAPSPRSVERAAKTPAGAASSAIAERSAKPSRAAREPSRATVAPSRAASGATAPARRESPVPPGPSRTTVDAPARASAEPPTVSRPASLAGAVVATAVPTRGTTVPRRASTSRAAAAQTRVVAAKPVPSSFWVQVGAYRTLAAVSEIAARLRNQPIVIDMPEAREPILRVLVGPFRDHAGAVAALRDLKAKGLRPFIATID